MFDPVVDTTTLPNDTAGLLEAVKAERRAKAAAEARATALAAELETTKTAAEAQVATFRTHAEMWQAHTAAQERARDEANAAKLAALPDGLRATIGKLGLKGEPLSELLASMPAVSPPSDPAQPATPATPAQPPAAPVIPAGGAVPGGAQSAGLAPEIAKWVETSRKDLRGASNAAVEAAYKSYGPGAKAPK